MPTIRVAEALAALSLTTDLASGMPFEKGLATCAVSTAFGAALGLPSEDLRDVYHTALLRAVGCTSYASENAALFDDDTSFQAALKVIDPGDNAVFGAQLARFGAWSGPARQPVLARRFRDVAATESVRALAASCEVSRALGPRLGLSDATPADHPDHMTTSTALTRNEAVLGRAVDRWNAGDLDGYLELCDSAVRLHGYAPEPMDRTAVAGFSAGILAAFPGCSLTLHETFTDGDRLVCRLTLAGRQDGPFLGVPPTGRDVVLPGITVLHFRDERCVETWSCADMLGALVQIGAVPPPA